MNKYITYIIYLIIAFVTIVAGFFLYSVINKNKQQVPGRLLDVAETIITIPAPQLVFYGIIMGIIVLIIIYNIFKPKYGLPSDVFKFVYKKPFDTKTIYLYKNKQNYIPGGILKFNANNSSTYGLWLYVSGVDNGIMKNNGSWVNTTKPKKVLYRGTVNDPKLGIYIRKDINDLIIKFNTTDSDNNEQMVLENIPLNRWFQIVLIINENKTATLYLNGKLIQTYLLRGTLNIDQTMNMYIGDETGDKDGTFSGLLYKGFYSPSVLSSNVIHSIYNKQKNQVLRYYKKYLEPTIKKNNKPICESKKK